MIFFSLNKKEVLNICSINQDDECSVTSEAVLVVKFVVFTLIPFVLVYLF